MFLVLSWNKGNRCFSFKSFILYKSWARVRNIFVSQFFIQDFWKEYISTFHLFYFNYKILDNNYSMLLLLLLHYLEEKVLLE